MERYLNGETDFTVEEIKKAIRKGALTGKFFPVICGSSYKNKGVQPLLDCVNDYLPSPVDVPPVKGTNPNTGEEVFRKASNAEPFCGLFFKVPTYPFLRYLTIFLLFSG